MFELPEITTLTMQKQIAGGRFGLKESAGMGSLLRHHIDSATYRRIVAAITLNTLVLFIGTIAAESTVRHVENEVVHVRNSSKPRDGMVTVNLKEIWRAGGEDEELFFGLVPRVESDGDGNIYVLDTQLCHVHVFSPSGTLKRTLFREGDGPGEIRGPRDMFLMGDGEVGTVLETGGKVAFVHPNGDPAGGFSLAGSHGGIYSLVSGAGGGDIIVLAGTDIRRGERTEIRLRHNFLGSFTRNGEPIAVLAEGNTERNLTELLIDEREDMPPFLWCFDVSDDGTVYAVTDRDRYAISVFEPDGALKMIIHREYELFPRSDEDYKAFYGMIETSNENLPIEVTIDIEKNHAVVAYLHRGIHVLDDGTLWVLTERGARSDAPGVMAIFDVFDTKGVYVRRVALKAPHEGHRVGIIPVSPHRVVVIEGYFESLASQFGNGATFNQEDGDWHHPEVICYRMEPG